MKAKVRLMQTEEHEVNYPGYESAEVEWAQGESEGANTERITFPECIPLRQIVTHASVNLPDGRIFTATLDIPLDVRPGIAPIFDANMLEISGTKKSLWERMRKK